MLHYKIGADPYQIPISRSFLIRSVCNFYLTKERLFSLIKAMQNTEIRLNIKKNFATGNRAAGKNWCWAE